MGAPKTDDGRPIVSPIAFEEGTFLFVCGAGDHPENGRGEGPHFFLELAGPGEVSKEWQFNDWVKAVGGTGKSLGALAGDNFCLEIYAPATTLTPDAETGTVVLVDTGFVVEDESPLKIICPVPSGYGTHNVVTPIPVPASVGEPGFWDWSCPDTGKGTLVPFETPPDEDTPKYNLYDQPIPLARPATHLQLLADRAISIDTGNVKPMILLPHWKYKATLAVAGSRTVSVAWEMKTVRMRSTKIW